MLVISISSINSLSALIRLFIGRVFWAIGISVIAFTLAVYKNALAADTVDAVTSHSSQRFFTDSNSGLKWRFSVRDGDLRYARSTDGVNWVTLGSLPYQSPFFSVAFKRLAGQSYVIVATENPQGDIIVRRGLLAGRSLSFDTEVTALQRQIGVFRYTKPAITIDARGFIWLAAARLRSWLGERYQVATSRSIGLISDNSIVFGTPTNLGRPAAAIGALVLAPLTSGETMLAVSGESNSNLLVYRHNGTTWLAASVPGELAGSAFAGSNFNGRVTALCVDSAGQIFAGGDFSTADGLAANHVAVWNGIRWQSLGSGLNGSVLALAVDVTGNVYAAGEFTKAGATTVSYVAMWDGERWNGLDGGTDGVVRSIAITERGTVVIGGDFTQAGTVKAQHVAQWDGTTWRALGAASNGAGTDGTIYDIEVTTNQIYVVGAFKVAGSVSARGIARWDGSQWNACGEGIDGIGRAVTVSLRGEVYVAGDFSSASGVQANKIARWDGARWNALGAGISGNISSGGIMSDAFNKVYLGGELRLGSDDNTTYAAVWDGRSWASLRSEISSAQNSASLRGVAAVFATTSGGELIIGGEFQEAGLHRAAHIVRFEPTLDQDSPNRLGLGEWSPLSSVGMNGSVYAAAFNPTGDLFVGGNFTAIGGVTTNRIARWNGERWFSVGQGFDAPVRALAFNNAGDLFAGGDFTKSGSIITSHVAKLASGEWSALGAGVDGPVNALAFGEADQLFVGGQFLSASGIPASNIAIWSSDNWSVAQQGFDGAVLSLCKGRQGAVYAAGEFQRAGMLPANRIAEWTGSFWRPLSTGANATVRALTLDSTGSLIAGGDFEVIGDVSAKHIAAWDGSVWKPLGSGLPFSVDRMDIDRSGAIYVAGGSPSTADQGLPSGIWRWDRGWSLVATVPTKGSSALFIGNESGSGERVYIAEPNSFFRLSDSVASNQLGKSQVALLPGSGGDAHLFYIRSDGAASLRTYSARLQSWAKPVLIHKGVVDSITASLNPTSGQVVVWSRVGATLYSSILDEPYASVMSESEVRESDLESKLGEILENSETKKTLAQWDDTIFNYGVQIVGPPGGGAPDTPTPTPTPNDPIKINVTVVRSTLNSASGMPIAGLPIEIHEERGQSQTFVHRTLTDVNGGFNEVVLVDPESELFIKSKDSSLAILEVSGPATEFNEDKNISVPARAMIEPLRVCRIIRDGGSQAVFTFSNQNLEQIPSKVSITALDAKLLGDPALQTDDLLLNSLDYVSGKRVIPISDALIDPGQQISQQFISGNGNFAVPYESALGELTWSILGARIVANESTELCPDSFSSLSCKALDKNGLALPLRIISATRVELEKRFAKNSSTLRIRIRALAKRARDETSAIISAIKDARDCSLLSAVPTSCRATTFPMDALIKAYSRCFTVKISGASSNQLKKYRASAIRRYKASITKALPQNISICGAT